MRRSRWLAAAAAALLAAAAWPVRGAAQVPPPPPPDPRVGVVEAVDAPARATELGAAWTRVTLHWGEIQPDGPEDWQMAALSANIAREREAGREVVGLLIGVPAWAADSGGLPRGLDLPPDDSGNLWAGFVREAASRFSGEIDHWIIWNEPDIREADHPAFTWPGSVEDMARLQQVAYLAAKDANPAAVVHLPAMSHWWSVQTGRDLYFPQLLDALLALPGSEASNAYYDVATLHVYFDPATVYDLLGQYRAFHDERGLSQPFWLVETNAAPSSDPDAPAADVTFAISLLEQAAYMPQALSLALAGGAERAAIYKLIDVPGDEFANPEPFGLVRQDGSHRPAFVTTRVAFEMLAGTEQAVWTARGDVSQVTASAPRKVTRVLWSRMPAAQVAAVPVLGEGAELVDMWGNRAPIAASDGVYEVALYAGECQQTVGDYCMIGGPPVYLVEQVGASRVEDVPGPERVTALAEVPGARPMSGMPAAPAQEQRGRPPVVRWVLLGAIAVIAAIFEFRVRRRLLKRLQGRD